MKVTEVVVDDEAKKYINEKSKDNSITVTMINRGSVWRPQLEPSVGMEEPDNKNAFKRFDINGVSVYVKRDIEFRKNKIKVSIGKMLWKKYLKVEDYI